MKENGDDTGWMEGVEALFVRIIDDYVEAHEEDLYETRSRSGIFSAALIIWLTICQRLQGRQSLAGVLESFSHGTGALVRSRNKDSKKTEASLNTGGLSRARERMQLETVRAVSQYLSEHLIKEACESYRWRNRMVVLIDGTIVTLTADERILKEYAPMKNQHRRSRNPQLLCLCAHELFTSVALPPCFGPHRGSKATSEMRLYHEMVERLPDNSLIVGDRYLGKFPVAYAAEKRGHQVLLRLAKSELNALVGQQTTSDFVKDVTWKVSPYVANKYALPADTTVTGRVIQYTFAPPGFRPEVLLFFTTSPEPADELIKLYAQRERIENDIRSLKYLMGLEMINSKSPGVVEKELLLTFSAYNLMRSILAKAATKLGISPRQISFSRAANVTKIYGNKLRACSSSAERKEIVDKYLKALSQVKHPNRKKRRLEPRKCTRRRQLFPLMKKSRQEEREDALNAANVSGINHR